MPESCFKMSLSTLTHYWPLGRTPKSLSELDAGVLVLFTSLVSSCQCAGQHHAHQVGAKLSHLLFRRFEPHSAISCVILLIVVPALLSAPISYAGRSTYTALPLAFAAYLSGLLFFTFAYRLSPFHPLANYPGPVLAKSSKIWGAYHSAIGDQHRCLKRLHDRYGDVVRIGSRPHPPFETPSLTFLQAPMNYPFATHPLSTPYSAKVVFPKVQVCANRALCWKTCLSAMIRMEWLG